MNNLHCRGCGRPLHSEDVFCDLGAQPLANALLERPDFAEPIFPLRPLVCRECLLVQLPVAPSPNEVFGDSYPFFSSENIPWLAHCKSFAKQAATRLGLGATSRVLDIGSNDGAMLRPFRGLGIPALGVEPCAGVAQHALMQGFATTIDWWGRDCAERLKRTVGTPTGKSWSADLVIATNVLAHVPDLLNFLDGVNLILAPGGAAVLEVPYIGPMLSEGRYDQIYAEHLCYFSVTSLSAVLRRCGLELVDLEWISTHGGSMRAWVQPIRAVTIRSDAVATALCEEERVGLQDRETYLAFAEALPERKRHAWHVLSGLIGKRMAGYGASAKAVVTFNYLGVGPDLLPFVADVTPVKQGKWLPGVRIPVRPPEELTAYEPEVVVNTLWNWRKESEANIRRACPRAEIVYLSEPTQTLAAAA